jgi:hypothetical protein
MAIGRPDPPPASDASQAGETGHQELPIPPPPGDERGRGARCRSLHPIQLSDAPWVLGLMAAGLWLQLRYYSGYGLGDDPILRGEISSILTNHSVLGDNASYRVAWWFPTVLSCRLFGLTEAGLLLPIMAAATLGTGLVYVFGKALWGRPGAVIAALLLIVHPLHFAYSTMLASDVIVSFLSAAAILLALHAICHPNVVWRRRLWVLSAAVIFITYHGKCTALLLVLPIAAIAWTRRDQVDRAFLYFLATVAALTVVTGVAWYGLTGDALYPFHIELKMQGLSGPEAPSHRIGSFVFWIFPRLLFLPDALGDLLFSVYPHLLIVLAAAGLVLGLRTAPEIFWWFLVVFLGLQFNVQRVGGVSGGVWISGFRNVRHAHILVYPVVLLLAGYLVGLRARWPRIAYALLGFLLALSTWQSISTATKTAVAFTDRRMATQYLATLPPGTVHADVPLHMTWILQDVQTPGWMFHELPDTPGEIAAVTDGYLVTGGAREPYYACRDCMVKAAELPPGRWRLLAELPGPPPTPWRREPVRIWQAAETVPVTPP